MYFNLAKEAKDLKKDKENLEERVKEYLETEEVMKIKNQIILELEEELGKFRSKNHEDAKHLEDRIRENEGECESLKLRLDSFSKENQQKDFLIEKLEQDNKKLREIVKIETENCEKMKKDLQNKEKQLEECEKHMNRLNRQIEILNNEKTNSEEDNSVLKRVISEKNEALEMLNSKVKETHEEMTNLEDEVRELRNHTVLELEKKIRKLQEENSLKSREIVTVRDSLNKLNEELGHLQDLVIEKDRIIARFKEDSEQLQTNLESIQSKMQETGNIIDLGKKLRDEQVKNSELTEEIQLMRAELTAYKFMDKDPMEISIDEITGKMREELNYSAQLDSNIINATEDVENVGELEDTLSKLKLKYRDLSKKYAEAQENNNTLLKRIEKNRFEFNAVQLEDAKLIEQLRIHLDAATQNEADLEQSVEMWKKKCETLEIEVSKLKSRLSNTNSRTESTEYKTLPTKESQELLKLKNDLAALNSEIAKCKNEINSLKKSKKELESNLKYSKEMAELKHREIENLEKNLEEKCKRERELKEKYMESNEILQDKIKEVENSRLLIDDMDQERKTMKEQINRLNANLRLLEEERRKPPVSQNKSFNIADQLMNKIEEINATVRNDRRTMDLILRLTNDNKLLKNKILELETSGTTNATLESPLHRANYLFSKCLRIESYRKSLIWQKNYLISILGSYQYTTDLGPVEKLQGQKKLRFSGIRKFRCFVYTIIAILRMKFIVRRWHSGARMAENVNSRYQNVSVNFQRIEVPQSSLRQSNFQVGQPVSSQQFAQSSGVRSRHVGGHGFQNSLDVGTVLGSSDSRLNVESGMSDRTRDIPWSGASPPCKERSSSGRPRISQNLALLKAPQLLSQYAERYNKIQENLEILLNPNPPA
ncbi:hypothetical protein WA026_001366 [Henosepilachna vigintioctopunctata]|uniref:Pericentrin/AKAP-450 centrosomal targeting domain-containing protein n=1 Tax=Henosepilachna vigintioctopunctata TaxID=420089 RepID=A0AAW1UI18_9CUCU